MDPKKNWHGWKKNLDSFLGDEFFQNFEGIFQYNQFPQVNVYQTENEVICVASIPGLNDVDSVDVYVEHQTIDLKGRVDIQFKGFKLAQNEIFNGHFERKIQLPFPVKDDRVDATYQNGLLIIHLHRLIPEDNYKQRISVRKIDD